MANFERELEEGDEAIEGLTVDEVDETQLALTDKDARVETDEEITKEEDGARYQTFRGEKFKLAKTISYMTLAEWAASSEYGAASGAGLAAIFHILQDILAEEEFERFRNHARRNPADSFEDDAADLVNFASAAVEVFTARPTEQPASSASGSRKTSRGSTGRSSGRRAKASKR